MSVSEGLLLTLLVLGVVTLPVCVLLFFGVWAGIGMYILMSVLTAFVLSRALRP